jgi:sulfoxide reductase heme-binding subunit YedZ
MLVLALACTPMNTLFHFRPALKARRTFGLYVFFYAFLHVSIFVVLDYGFDLRLMVDTIAEKRYILAGLSAFLIILPLAITSFDWWKKRLGKNWKRLHRLVYLAALLVVLHYTWLVKSDIRVPLLYGLGIVILLVLRIPAVRRKLANLNFPRLG